MPRPERNVVAYIAVNTAGPAEKNDALDGRRAAVSRATRACDLKVQRWFVDDVSQALGVNAVRFPDLIAASDSAVREGLALVISGDIETDVLRAVRARLLESELELYDLDDLRAERLVLKANSEFVKQTGEARERAATNGRKMAKANGARFGSPNPEKGRRAAAIVRKKLSEIRQRELNHWFDMAEQAGAVSPPQIALWLNDRLIRTAQGLTWTAANVRIKLQGRFRPLPLVEGGMGHVHGEETSAQEPSVEPMISTPSISVNQSVVVERNKSSADGELDALMLTVEEITIKQLTLEESDAAMAFADLINPDDLL